jgi:hypothetical protein
MWILFISNLPSYLFYEDDLCYCDINPYMCSSQYYIFITYLFFTLLSRLLTRQWSDRVIRSVVRKNWLVHGGRIDREVQMMVTPRVVEEVRNHFSCWELEGAELEDQGEEGTALTHWEKRVFEVSSSQSSLAHYETVCVYAHVCVCVCEWVCVCVCVWVWEWERERERAHWNVCMKLIHCKVLQKSVE